MKYMHFLLCIPFSGFLFAAEEGTIRLTATSQEQLVIGHVAPLQVKIENLSESPVAVLGIRPEQPCEEPIELVRPLYGSIRYDEEKDEYEYQQLVQSATQIPVAEGFVPPGKSIVLNLIYRPFSDREELTIRYAVLATGQRVYARAEEAGAAIHFARNGTDFIQVILPDLLNMEKFSTRVEVAFEGITGERRKLCYCEALSSHVDTPPYSLYKDWDSGKEVEFRVGENQEGFGPDERPAGWKFLDEYPVYYGDGMYTHGEFVIISKHQASAFMKKIAERFSIRRTDYFFKSHYYDLEPMQ